MFRVNHMMPSLGSDTAGSSIFFGIHEMGQLLIHVQSILLDLPRGEKVVIEWEPDDGS